MQYIINESSNIRSVAKKVKKLKGDKIRMECVLQTVGDINRNRRRYSKELMESGMSKVADRIEEGSFLGELDHPITKDPGRQVTVLYTCASHRIMEYGWEGNRLVGVLETLRTPNGTILKNLAEDGIPVGYSFRGMGDLRQIHESSGVVYDVIGPLHVVTWDAVSHPSHSQAKLIRITDPVERRLHETASNMMEESIILHESSGIKEMNGLICTTEGVCYIPNDFDKMVQTRVAKLIKSFL
jgi:hypothetical protein